MAENIIIDKVIGESGASNSNSIDQSQTIESKVVHEIISLVKLILMEVKRLFVTIVRKSILLTQKNMVQRQCLLI